MWTLRTDQGRGLRAASWLALLGVILVAGCGSDEPPPPSPPPTITTQNLPDGTVGLTYNAILTGNGGTLPFSWQITTGALPDGLTLNDSTGQVTGTPTTPQTATFTVLLTDGEGITVSRDFTVGIGAAGNPQVELASVASDGTPANSNSGSAALSPDGRFLAFTSFADNLAPNDTNQNTDIFLRDRSCGVTLRVSVATDGTEGNLASLTPSVSALAGDTIFIAYISNATNLVANDTNATSDVLVTAVQVSGCTLTVTDTARASVATDGTESDGASSLPSISADGKFVAYRSVAGNLVEGDSNAIPDIFITELGFNGSVITTGPTRRYSTFLRVGDPDRTADTFSDTTIGDSTLMLTPGDHASQLVEIMSGTGEGQVRQITDNDETTLTVDPAWGTLPDATSMFRVYEQTTRASNRARLSPDATFVAFDTQTTFAGDTGDDNVAPDVFIQDRVSGAISRVSVAADGTAGDGLSLVSALGNNAAFALFVSRATNLVANDTNGVSDLFFLDRIGNQLERVSVASDGSEATGCTDTFDILGNLIDPSCSAVPGGLSGGARLAVFSSRATNLVGDDRNGFQDVFLRDRTTGETLRISLGLDGINPNRDSFDVTVSLDGSVIAFTSEATNLILNDTNSVNDVFLVVTGVVDPPMIVASGLAAARVQTPYEASLLTVGGMGALHFSVIDGSLPPGVFLDSATGQLIGLPQRGGEFRFTVLVSDSDRPTRRTRRTLVLRVAEDSATN